jgi:HPt (histidine-containing phosphotransfer) domain-containing protein
MQNSLIDLSFLYDIADNDAGYINDVLEIFLSTVPDGLVILKQHIDNGEWEAIYKQSHFLKSSLSVVKVGDMFEKLAEIERLAKDRTGAQTIRQLFDNIMIQFNEAHPLIIAEKSRHQSL